MDRMRFLEHKCKVMHWSFLEFTRRHSKDGSIQENTTGSQGARDVRIIQCKKSRLRGKAGRTQGSLVQAPNAMCRLSIKTRREQAVGTASLIHQKLYLLLYIMFQVQSEEMV